VCAGAVLAGLFAAVGPAIADPPNPSDQALQQAANNKDALAALVGQLTAQVASAQAQVVALNGQAELAEQKYAYALQQYQQAQEKATAARAAVGDAQHEVAAAQTRYVMYAQSVYMHGGVAGTAGNLLTASDPNALLEQSALQRYESAHQLSAIGQLQRATVTKSNADAAARKAEQDAAKAKDAAQQAQQQAEAAAQQAQQQAQQLQTSLASKQTVLNQAKDRLATLTNQRAAYDKWKAHQEWLAEQARLKAERERKAREAAAARARLRAQQQAQQQAPNHGGGGTSPSSGSHAPIPTGGSWTAAKGRAAVARAMNWLGEDYAWAGGNSRGPTYGVCAGDGAWNDCHVVGFDCSGLALYAWAPYTSLAHYTVTQYNQGSYHPSVNNLMPGDLVFWSYNGSLGGVHHVAIYIGNNQVIQAPQSGDIVRVTNLWDVSSGYFGATRPLT